MHYDILYPIGKSVWGCFSENIEGPIDIGIEVPLARCPIQAPLYSLATELRLAFFLAIDGKSVAIQEAGLAGVTLFLQDHLYPDEFGFVAEHVHETGMRDLHKVLGILLPHLGFLLPVGIFAENERPNSFR